MTVTELAAKCGFKAITLPEPERDVNGAYVGDLLSWVMGRATAECAWITIMSNVNVIAVASLSDAACVIFAEGVIPESDIVKLAEEKGINLISSHLPTYESAVPLSEVLK